MIESTAERALVTHMLCCSWAICFSAAASSENDQGSSASDSLPNEGALSSELKISRTAVREAIKMLTAKGLVGSRPRRGTEVRPVSDWNLLDSDVLRWLRQSPPDRSH